MHPFASLRKEICSKCFCFPKIIDVFFKYTKKLQNPSAFRIFTILLNEKKRTLITPIPGYSTHGETKYLTPFREWSKEL